VKKGRQPQIYKIKWDDGSTMNCQEEHVEYALEEDSEEDSEDARDGEYNSDRDSGNQSTENEDERQEQEHEEAKTDSENDMAEGELNDGYRGDRVEIGETVECGKDDDPLRKPWTRIGDLTVDERTEPHHETVFKNLHIDDQTTQLDIFLAMMPLKPAQLLAIVREGSDRSRDRLIWKLEHMMAAL
jgi:hypothetical protein